MEAVAGYEFHQIDHRLIVLKQSVTCLSLSHQEKTKRKQEFSNSSYHFMLRGFTSYRPPPLPWLAVVGPWSILISSVTWSIVLVKVLRWLLVLVKVLMWLLVFLGWGGYPLYITLIFILVVLLVIFTALRTTTTPSYTIKVNCSSAIFMLSLSLPLIVWDLTHRLSFWLFGWLNSCGATHITHLQICSALMKNAR